MNLKLFTRRALSNVPFYISFILLFYIITKCLMYEKRPSLEQFADVFIFDGNYTTPPPVSGYELKRLTAKIENLNCEMKILNLEKCIPLGRDATIIAVQVHTDILRLQFLINSLKHVRYIDTVLIIFSHSFYDENINNIIRNIGFCKVLQVFYPYSLQMNPNKFPGIDPDDCGNKTQKKMKTFCSDRDAIITEHKQHWWWKANLIFNSLPWSTKYDGTVIFLEENDYVLPDLLQMLHHSQELMTLMPDIDIISLGGFFLKNTPSNLLLVDAWKPPYYKGLALNRSAWLKISQHSSYFCVYDDSSWSYSLLNLYEHTKKGHADMVACISPRVISAGIFDNVKEAVQVINKRIVDMELFPRGVKAVLLFNEQGRVTEKMKPPDQGNGGWGDARDHLLCLDPLMVTSTESDDCDSTTNMPSFS